MVQATGREKERPRLWGSNAHRIHGDSAAATPGDYDGAVSTSTPVFDGDGAAQLGRLAVCNLPGERRSGGMSPHVNDPKEGKNDQQATRTRQLGSRDRARRSLRR